MKFILGSASPRRRAILSAFILDYEAVSPDFDERSVSTHLSAPEYVQEIAEGKALKIAKKHPSTPVLTADTTVFFEDKFLNKPESKEEAFAMLRDLSGNRHEVFSCVTLCQGEKLDSIVHKTAVYLRNLSDAQIHSYITSFEPLDKAGAYGIQDGFGILVQRIEGNSYDVVGFPISAVEILLAKIGINLWQKFAP